MPADLKIADINQFETFCTSHRHRSTLVCFSTNQFTPFHSQEAAAGFRFDSVVILLSDFLLLVLDHPRFVGPCLVEKTASGSSLMFF